MNTFRLNLIAAAIFAAATPLHAQNTSQQDEIIVTARRSAETVDATLATVSIITRAEIEQSQARDLLDLLRLQPGVDLARTGGDGQSTALFLRGSNSTHTLVLIDGVRVSPLLSGAYDYAHLPIAQIERIEIVRGPQAAYWGSEAIGGVIQIFTRQPEHFSARLGGGSHDSYSANASAAWRGERGSIGATVGRNRSAGISAQNVNGFSFDPDRDGYENTHVSVRAETLIGAQKLAFTALRTDSNTDFDQGETSIDDVAAGLSLSGDINDRWSHRLALGSASDRLETPVYFSIFDSRRRTLDWQNKIQLDEQSLLHVGINYVEEHGRDISSFDNSANINERRDNAALHLGYQRTLGAHDLELAGRHDDNSQFGGNSSLQAAWGWRFTEAWRLVMNYGEGFRAPNLNEQFSPGFGGLFAGNPNLDPEHSRSVELGFDGDLSAHQRLQVHLFSTRIRDLISFSGGNTFQAENIARASIEGVEITHTWNHEAWQWRNSITVQDAENTQTGTDLLRRPGRKWSSVADYRFDNGASVGTEWLLSSSREDFAASLPGYGVLALRAAFPINDFWRVEARVDNVLDKRYELARGYNTPDRSGTIAIVFGD